MKSINRYINERLVLNKRSKLTPSELKNVVDTISNVLDIEGYANQPDSEDNVDDIIKGIKEGVLISGITTPCFFTNDSYYAEISDSGVDADNIIIVSDKHYNKFYRKINYKNAEKVFDSNEMYGLTIYANEYGINLSFYEDSIFVIDKYAELIKDIDI